MKKGLNPLDRLIVEKIRNAKEVVISVNFDTRDEINLRLGGVAPHDIAIAVQNIFNKANDTRRTN